MPSLLSLLCQVYKDLTQVHNNQLLSCCYPKGEDVVLQQSVTTSDTSIFLLGPYEDTVLESSQESNGVHISFPAPQHHPQVLLDLQDAIREVTKQCLVVGTVYNLQIKRVFLMRL